jgi:hypothetical protein
MPECNVTELKAALGIALRSRTPLLIESDPGLGKTAIVNEVGQGLGWNVGTLLASLCDPTDLGGFPALIKDRIVRNPMGVIKDACEQRTALFLDEVNLAAPAVQAALLRGVHEGRWGDAVMHPESVCIMACNPVNQTLGGSDLSLPFLGRVTRITYRPTVSDVQAFFDRLGDDGSRLRDLGTEFSALLERSVDLLQTNPPKSAATGNPWASPRSWERALRVTAAAEDAGESAESPLLYKMISGSLGEDVAASYLTLRKMRLQLPSIADVIKAPDKAALPSSVDMEIAALGLLAQVCLRDPCAGWVYMDRLGNEAKVVAYRVVAKHSTRAHAKSPHYAAAEKVKQKSLAMAGRLMQGKGL